MTSWLYEVFGGTLRSDLPIDELPGSPLRAPDWTLRVVEGTTPAPVGEPLGVDTVFGETRVRAYRRPDGLCLVFDDTGRFDVSVDGSVITWYRPPDAALESAHADITSRVLALAMHAAGVFTLHASAVSIEGAGVAFLAPKHHGKSTLCGALVLAGARALSDDTVPVHIGGSPRLSPGLPRLRLWSDAARRLFGTDHDEAVGLRKKMMDQLNDAQLETRTVPFRAAYILSPVADLPGGAVAERHRLDSVGATMALVMHAKLGPLLTGTESPVMLSRAAEVARVVPAYALHIRRDLERVGEVARLLVGWHAGEGDVAGRNA